MRRWFGSGRVPGVPCSKHPAASGGNAGDGVRGGVPPAAPAPSRLRRGPNPPAVARTVPAVGQRFDDRLPDPLPQPRPHGWYEVFCCGAMVLGFAALVVVLAIIH